MLFSDAAHTYFALCTCCLGLPHQRDQRRTWALLFARAPPARDLFAEVNAGALYWTMFFALVLAWALCVHYAARKALEQQVWAAGSHPLPLEQNIAAPLKQQFAFIGTWLPRLLGLVCFGAVGCGVVGAETTSALMDSGRGAVYSYFQAFEAATVAAAVLFLVIAIFRRLYRTPLMVLLRGDPDTVIVGRYWPAGDRFRASATYRDGNGHEQRVSRKPTTCSKSFLSATFRCLPQQSLAAGSLPSHPMARFGATIRGVRRNAPLTAATSRMTA